MLEQWKKTEQWNNGIVEYWVKEALASLQLDFDLVVNHYSIIPTFQYSKG